MYANVKNAVSDVNLADIQRALGPRYCCLYVPVSVCTYEFVYV